MIITALEQSDVEFQKRDLLPQDFNLSKITSVPSNQLINVKAKLTCLEPAETVHFRDTTLQKANGLLVDEHGTIKIILWQDDISKVEDGGTYQFKNLRLKKNKVNGELYVNPAKHGSQITPSPSFTTNPAEPKDVPTEFVVSAVSGEVMGVSDIHLHYYCVR